MASHMSSLGLPMSNENDFRGYFNKTYENGVRIKAKNGIYIRWDIGDGVELWAQLNSSNEAIGMNPHFSGSAIMKVLLSKRVVRENDTQLDGAFYAWASPQNEEDGSGEFPFVFDLPNLNIYDRIKVPQIVLVQLSAFAHEFEAFKSEEDFYNSQKNELKFASKSFIPSGLFSPDGEDTLPPSSEAIFTGHVEDFKKIINCYSGCKFYWVKVNTLGGEIDVVIDPNILKGDLNIGGIVSGSFWISGKFISNPVIDKKSFWDRLIRK